MGSDSFIVFLSLTFFRCWCFFYCVPSALNWNDINFQMCYQATVTCFWRTGFEFCICFFMHIQWFEVREEVAKMLTVQMAMIGLKDWQHIIILCTKYMPANKTRHSLSCCASHKYTYIYHPHCIESSTKKRITALTSKHLNQVKYATVCFAKWSISTLPCHSKNGNFYPNSQNTKTARNGERANWGRVECVHLNSNHVTWILSLKQNQINLMV